MVSSSWLLGGSIVFLCIKLHEEPETMELLGLSRVKIP